MKYILYFFIFFIQFAVFSCKNKTTIAAVKTISDEEQRHQLEKQRLLLLYNSNYSELKIFSEGLAVFRTDSACGVIDTSGKIIFSITNSEHISSYNMGYAVVTFKGNKQAQAYIDKTGKIVFDVFSNGYVYAEPFDEFGHALIIDKHNKKGLINNQFKIVIIPQYDELLILSRNRFRVIKKDKSGIIDSTQKTLVDFLFDRIETYTTDNKMFCINKGNWGIYDSTGKLISLYDCDQLIYTEGLVVLEKMNKKNVGEWTLADTAGKIVVAYGKYSDCSSFSNGLAMVYNETEPSYKSSKSYKKSVGFVDITGKKIIPLQFEDGSPFCEGLARVKKNGKWGFIDVSGKIILNFVYDEVGVFNNGFASVTLNGREMIIDKKGNILLQ